MITLGAINRIENRIIRLVFKDDLQVGIVRYPITEEYYLCYKNGKSETVFSYKEVEQYFS